MHNRSLRVLSCLCLLLLAAGCSMGKKQANQADIHYMLGLSNLSDQNPTMALREFLQAAALDPQRADIQNGLGQAYFLKQAYPEAEQHFLRAIELDPKNPQYENNLAALYLTQQHWDEAIRHFLKAAHNLFFANPEISLTGAGFANFQKGNYVDAIGLYREAINHNPRYAQAYLRLGETYYAMDKTSLAVEEYSKALELYPGYTEAHFRLAVAYLKQHQPDQARKHFQEVLKNAPDSEFARQSTDYLKLLR